MSQAHIPNGRCTICISEILNGFVFFVLSVALLRDVCGRNIFPVRTLAPMYPLSNVVPTHSTSIYPPDAGVTPRFGI